MPSLAILFLPVTLLGVYSPFAIRLCCARTQRSGTVSGDVYGVSTAGSIVGTLGTTFFLIPLIGTRAITLRSARPVSVVDCAWWGSIASTCSEVPQSP